MSGWAGRERELARKEGQDWSSRKLRHPPTVQSDTVQLTPVLSGPSSVRRTDTVPGEPVWPSGKALDW